MNISLCNIFDKIGVFKLNSKKIYIETIYNIRLKSKDI